MQVCPVCYNYCIVWTIVVLFESYTTYYQDAKLLWEHSQYMCRKENLEIGCSRASNCKFTILLSTVLSFCKTQLYSLKVWVRFKFRLDSGVQESGFLKTKQLMIKCFWLWFVVFQISHFVFHLYHFWYALFHHKPAEPLLFPSKSCSCQKTCNG